MKSTITALAGQSSAAKKAEAAFKIAFARRNWAFSRLSRFQLGRLLRRYSRPGTLVHLGLTHPLPQRFRRGHPQQAGDLGHRRPSVA